MVTRGHELLLLLLLIFTFRHYITAFYYPGMSKKTEASLQATSRKKRQELRDSRLLHGRMGSKCVSTSFSLRVDDMAMLDYICAEVGQTYSEMVRNIIRVKYLQVSSAEAHSLPENTK